MNERNEWDHSISAGAKEGQPDCIRINEVAATLKKMKKHEAPGLSGLGAEIIQPQGILELGEYWIYTHTHTVVLLLFWNLSGTTRVSRYQKGETRKGKTNMDLLEQEIVSGSGICWAICKSALHPRQPRQHPTTQDLYNGIVYNGIVFLQCFDIVIWVAGRSSGL